MKINQQCEGLILGLTSIITCKNYNKPDTTATCFFCKSISGKIILVTNKHVLKDCKSFRLKLTTINKLDNSKKTVNYDINMKDDIVYHAVYDIATLDITSAYNIMLNNTNYIPQLCCITENGILTDYNKLPVFQEILMLGYPNGIINSETNHPIIRTGYAATNIKEKYNGRELFLTDIPTFGGSSGSPILISNENGDVYLIGINAKTYTQPTRVYSSNNRLYHKRKTIGYVDIPNNIGIAVNSKIIKEMINYYNK